MMKSIFKALGAFILVAYVSAVGAQNFKSALDSTQILIGSQTLFTVEVNIKEGQNVRFPILPDTLTQGLEVVNQFAADTVDRKNGQMLIKKRYLITSFDSGSYVMPQIPVLLFNGKSVDTLLTKPLPLKVNTVAIDTTKVPLYDIKGTIKAPYTFAEIAIIVLAVLLLVAIVVGLFMYFRRNKEQPLFTFTKKVVEPAHVKALREINELLQQKLWLAGKEKQYYSELIDILRRYINSRMGINAMEMTTFEILSSLKDAGYANKVILERLTAALYVSDMVKFAKYASDPIENDQSAKSISAFIEDTKEVVSLAEDTANGEAGIEDAPAPEK